MGRSTDTTRQHSDFWKISPYQPLPRNHGYGTPNEVSMLHGKPFNLIIERKEHIYGANIIYLCSFEGLARLLRINKLDKLVNLFKGPISYIWYFKGAFRE